MTTTGYSLWTSPPETWEDPLGDLDPQALLDLDPEELRLSPEDEAELEKRLRPYRTRVTHADLMVTVD